MSRNPFGRLVRKALKMGRSKVFKSAGRTLRQTAVGLAAAMPGMPHPLAKGRPPSVKSAKRKIRTLAPPATANAVRPPAILPGSSFRKGVFELDGRNLHYKLFLPTGDAVPAVRMPLLIMLHGCGQTPDDFATGTKMNHLAHDRGLMVAYPEQSRSANANRCWNWFNPGDQIRGAGEPALIAELTRHLVDKHGGDPDRVYISGLSAGGATAAIVAFAYPEIYAAVGVHSGLPIGAAQSSLSALVAMKAGSSGTRQSVPMPTIVFHGEADDVVHPRNGRSITARSLAAFSDLSETTHKRRATGGNAYRKTAHRGVGRKSFCEHWHIEDSGHGWSGGDPAGSFTVPSGPDASCEMVRFFLQHRNSAVRRAPPEP